MKKLVLVGVLALTVAAILEHQAWAWKNSNFGVGLNWSYQSGGNNLLWGVFRNGQPGECDLPNCPKAYYGHAPMDYGYDGHFMPAMPVMSMPAPMTVPAIDYASQSYWYGQPYQAVNYAPMYPSWYGR